MERPISIVYLQFEVYNVEFEVYNIKYEVDNVQFKVKPYIQYTRPRMYGLICTHNQ